MYTKQICPSSSNSTELINLWNVAAVFFKPNGRHRNSYWMDLVSLNALLVHLHLPVPTIQVECAEVHGPMQ